MWQGGSAMSSICPGFQAETMCRRESGFWRSCSMTWLIWSMWPPSGVGQERHWTP